MERIILIAIMAGLVFPVLAEYRLWTDKNGNVLEAELAGTQGQKIVLKKPDGQTIALSPMVLSDADRAYLKDKVPGELLGSEQKTADKEKPPSLDISFKKLTHTDISRYTSSHKDIDNYCSVTIRKTNREPYSGRLKAELYVIGARKKEDQFVLLDRSRLNFYLTDSQSEITLHSSRIRLRKYHFNDDYNTEFKGYLAVILDGQGKIVAMESAGSKFEEHYEQIARFRKGTYFTKQYKVDHVDSDTEYY